MFIGNLVFKKKELCCFKTEIAAGATLGWSCSHIDRSSPMLVDPLAKHFLLFNCCIVNPYDYEYSVSELDWKRYERIGKEEES